MDDSQETLGIHVTSYVIPRFTRLILTYYVINYAGLFQQIALHLGAKTCLASSGPHF